MTHILYGGRLPGLAAALHQHTPPDGSLVVTSEGADIRARLEALARPLDVLILDDGLTLDTPTHDAHAVATMLWELLYLAGERPHKPQVRLVLGLQPLPPQIRDDLLGEGLQPLGGAAQTHVMPPPVGPAQHQAAVTWVLEHLALPTLSGQQRWVLPLSAAGGAGKTTQLAYTALAWARQGRRTLLVDADFGNGYLQEFFKVAAAQVQPLMGLRDEYPHPHDGYPPEAIQRRIHHHPSGVDLLLSGAGIREKADMPMAAMQALLQSLPALRYDVVCVDAGADIKGRPYAISALRAGALGLVICQAVPKVTEAARKVLELLRHLQAPGQNRSMLHQSALLFLESERGRVDNIHDVRSQLTRQYPEVLDLGIIPRDPATISLVEQSRTFVSVFDVRPRGPYSRAMMRVADQVATQLQLPPLAPPNAPLPRRPWWHRYMPWRVKEVS